MKKVIDWFKESNRWKHLVGGILVGVAANSWYCAIYTGVGVSAAMEFKDWKYRDNWDWIDFTVTVVGAVIGYGIRYGIRYGTQQLIF